MKKYKLLITSSLLLALIIATPVVSFADNNNKDKNGNGNKIENVNKAQNEKNQKNISWFGSNWFKGHSKSTIAPVISNVIVVSTKTNKATIKWETDSRSNSFVWYSTTTPIDTSVNPNLKRNDRVLKHKFELKKLEAGTKYYVVVGSANNIGIIKSAEISFTTPAIVVTPVVTPPVVDTTAPVISNIETTVSGSNVAISWKTNEATSSTIFYSIITPVDTTVANITKVVNNTLTKEHSLSIPNLTSNTLYHFILKSVDASNNTVSSSEFSFRTN